MTAPRIEIDLHKIRQNTRYLVENLESREITVTGVTKAVCGHPGVAQAMLDGGATDLADARVSNVERLREAGFTCPIAMIRTPMLSQVDRIVHSCDTSYNTEINVIKRLAAAAVLRQTVHNVILMVEMGDMREGILPENLKAIVQQVTKMPGVSLKGIGANFACLSAAAPDAATMTAFSALCSDIEEACGLSLERISGGNSANVPWALGLRSPGRIDNLRLGEAILLGVDPVTGDQIGDLHTDAFTLVAEVIETKVKPGPVDLSFADPDLARPVPDVPCERSIVAIGLQDTDIAGLTLPEGITGLAATSDHFVVRGAVSQLHTGSELKLQMNYSALMRAMSAPEIIKIT